jgi:hypothetical protein
MEYHNLMQHAGIPVIEIIPTDFISLSRRLEYWSQRTANSTMYGRGLWDLRRSLGDPDEDGSKDTAVGKEEEKKQTENIVNNLAGDGKY